MIINKKILSCLLFCSIYFRMDAQDYNKMCQKALFQNKPGETHSAIIGSTATYVTFLGSVSAKKKNL